MKFTVSCTALNKALKTISPAIAKNVVLPILENFKIVRENGKTKLYATDLKMSIITDIEVEAHEDFEAVIPFKMLFSLSSRYKSIPATIEVSQKGIMLFIDGKTFGIGGFEPVVNFPIIEDVSKDAVSIPLTSSLLYNLKLSTKFVQQEQFNQFQDVALSVKNGIFRVEANDKLLLFRYSEKTQDEKISKEASIPTSFVLSLSDVESASLFIDKKTVKIKTDNSVFIGRQTDEKYPYEQATIVLGEPEINCTIHKADLSSIVDDILSFNSDIPFVDFLFENNSIKISFTDAAMNYSFNDEIKSIHSVEREVFRLNAKQLKKIIDAYDEDEIKLFFPENGYSVKVFNEEKSLSMLIQAIVI